MKEKEDLSNSRVDNEEMSDVEAITQDKDDIRLFPTPNESPSYLHVIRRFTRLSLRDRVRENKRILILAFLLLVVSILITRALTSKFEFSLFKGFSESTHILNNSLCPTVLAEADIKFEHYIALTTLVFNKRKYIREWLEFYLMSGVTYFYIYDDESGDGMQSVLQPYIDENIVLYIKWPPEPKFNEDFSFDPAIKKQFHESLDKCFQADKDACKIAMNNDALRRSRGKVRWLGSIEANQFIYISETSAEAFSPAPLVQTLKSLEKHPMVTVDGYHYGTSGFITDARREDNQTYTALLTKTHQYHFTYGPFAPLNTLVPTRSFVNPFCACGSQELNFVFAVDVEMNDKVKKFAFDLMAPSDNHGNLNNILLNHYFWTSSLDRNQGFTFDLNPPQFNEVGDRIFAVTWAGVGCH
ncbi:MAG: hypothetical protein EOP34_07880 [Rickettsiales bacterium]|nr:MAG: hypothetical protein EOP34_07880 [Rickettsiales bacterium]